MIKTNQNLSCYILKIVDSTNPECWPVGSFICWHEVTWSEIEGSMGPGPFSGWAITWNPECAERFETKALARDYWKDEGMTNAVQTITTKPVKLTIRVGK